MTDSFTQIINNSIRNNDEPKLDLSEIVDYYNSSDTFRPFSAGLTELMIRSGYKGAADEIEAKSNYLFDKLKAINVTVAKQTIKDWFTDKRRPSFNSESRIKMFQLCFALSASFDNVKWFFNHIYFSRSFNCRTIEEAVYYYCFLNHLPYEHAQYLIQEISSYPDNINPSRPVQNFSTKEVTKKLSEYTTDEELLHFFQNNKHTFSTWNKTALSHIDKFFKAIIGPEESKVIIQSIKRDCKRIIESNDQSSKDIFKKSPYFNNETLCQCGLIIRETCHIALNSGEPPKDKARYILDNIGNQNTFSRQFVLNYILNMNPKLPKDISMPNVAKTNFPSKKILSDLLDPKKDSIYHSYDSIRKCLLLLHFYYFWCINRLESKDYGFDDFVDETNTLLNDCGYDELYAGNPYDWLFFKAATLKDPLLKPADPLTSLRLIVSEINPPD